MLHRMGNLYDYFAAEDDEATGATLEHAPDPKHFEVVDTKGIEPSAQLLRAVPVLVENAASGVTRDFMRLAGTR